MAENFVSREEFNGLKSEVQELKIELNENKSILTQIDKTNTSNSIVWQS